MKKNGKKKLQFEFAEDAINRLDELKTRTDSASRAEVIRRSLRLYEFAVEKVINGYTLKLEKDGEEIAFTILDGEGLFSQ